MQRIESLDDLIDRIAIEDTVNRYFHSVDRHDWESFRDTLADMVDDDHSDLVDAGPVTISGDEYVKWASQGVLSFVSTHHMTGNPIISIEGDVATCLTKMVASHWSESNYHTAFGYYDLGLRREGQGWKIHKFHLRVQAEHGSRSVFQVMS